MAPNPAPKRGLPKVSFKRFLLDRDLARWHANVARGSLITADVYGRRLRAFCEQMHLTPEELAKLSEKKLRDLMLDFITEEERKQRTGSYIDSTRKAVKSWLLHNGVRMTLPIRIKGIRDSPTLREERVPTQDELRAILAGSGTLRNRAMAVMMAHCGLRPEVLGNYKGDDGLRLKDFPDLELKSDSARFTRTPAMVVVRPELSKAGHRYFTFLSEEGCGYLSSFLEYRLRAGEKLTPESDLCRGIGRGSVGKKSFMRTISIGDGLREAIRKAGFPWRPYVLRAYFDTQLLLAESKGKVAHDYRVFWMGHKGSMEARYTTNKGRLPDAIVNDMREAYARCEPFLATIPSKSENQTQANIAKVLLSGLGYSEKDLAGVDFDSLDPAKFQELVQKKVTPSAPRQKQKVVDAGELPRYLSEGWTAVMTVGGNQVVLSPPGS